MATHARAGALAALTRPAQAEDRTARNQKETGGTRFRFQSTNSGSTKGGGTSGALTLPSGQAMNLSHDTAQGPCGFDVRAGFEDGAVPPRAGERLRGRGPLPSALRPRRGG